MAGFFDFFDDFDSIFSSISNRFNRPVRDQNPYSVYTSNKGYIIVCNTLGINKEDLKVTIRKEKGNPHSVLSISGESKIEKINFANSVNLRIRLNLKEEIEDISYETKNGLTLVYLKTKVDKTDTTLEAKCIDNSDDLDW